MTQTDHAGAPGATPTPEGKTMTAARRRYLLLHHVVGRDIIRQEDAAKAAGIDPDVAQARRNAILADNRQVLDRGARPSSAAAFADSAPSRFEPPSHTAAEVAALRHDDFADVHGMRAPIIDQADVDYMAIFAQPPQM